MVIIMVTLMRGSGLLMAAASLAEKLCLVTGKEEGESGFFDYFINSSNQEEVLVLVGRSAVFWRETVLQFWWQGMKSGQYRRLWL